MSILFKMLPKKNMLVQPPQVKYFPCAVMQGERNLKELSEKMSRRSTLTKADIHASLIGLTEVIGEELAAGRIVRLDGLGSFQITLKGFPAESVVPNGKESIKEARIVFKPAIDFKKYLKNLSFKRLR